MTIVLFDGKTIAADRQLTGGHTDLIMGFRRKLHPWSKGWYAYAGSTVADQWLREWLETGNPPQYKIKNFGCMYSENGNVFITDERLVPWNADNVDAVGNNRAAAIMLVHAGLSAEKAVKLICKYDITCGGPVDVVKVK